MKKNISFNHNLLINIRFKHSNCFIFDNSSWSMSTSNYTRLEQNTRAFLENLQQQGGPPIYTLSPDNARAGSDVLWLILITSLLPYLLI
jgi:hypothetical protein